MNKKVKKSLNEQMNTELPKALEKENIMDLLPAGEVIEIKRKNKAVKKAISLVACLTLVLGIIGIYFGLGLNNPNKDIDPVTPNGDICEVVKYSSYDKVYEKFDSLKKEYDKNKHVSLYSGILGVPESAITDDAAASDTVNEALTGTASNSYGTTNTQENGVDEGDIIKTDGKYLYIVNGDGRSVSIVEAGNGEMSVASKIQLGEEYGVKELYISNGKLIIVGGYYSADMVGTVVQGDIAVYDMAYGSAYANQCFVLVYDISDPENPEKINDYVQQGGFNSTRMIDSRLYTISNYSVNLYNDDYRDNCIPEITVNGVNKQIPADCISIVEESQTSTYTVITTLDLTKEGEPTAEAILGGCDEIYASLQGLFTIETVYNYKTVKSTTYIYRFEYTDTGVNFKCKGFVDGYINDQFSMSFDGNYFRIATTVTNPEESDENGEAISWSSNNNVNNLYILNDQMQTVGKVEDLAKGETIKSVRFVDDMAYVVTFRQTDPLFVIDLTDPTNPTVKSELKIPGFSQYLHPIKDGLLVGVGRDGTDTGENDDCKVSLFDVSDPYEPKESSILRVTNNSNAYCYTYVDNNHKAYINLENDEFAVPFEVLSYTINGYGYNKAYGAIYIRYRLEGDKLQEVARYALGTNAYGIGATYIDNVFYVLTHSYVDGTVLTAFDMNTNERLSEVKTAEVNG